MVVVLNEVQGFGQNNPSRELDAGRVVSQETMFRRFYNLLPCRQVREPGLTVVRDLIFFIISLLMNFFVLGEIKSTARFMKNKLL